MIETTTSGKPLVDFDAYMADRKKHYMPRHEAGLYELKMSAGEIKSFFTEHKSAFADRTAEEERKSFDAYFAFKDMAAQRNTKEHFETLKSKPEFSYRSDKDLEKLASMRSSLKEGFDKKGVASDIQSAMFDKFDRVYADPDALNRTDAIMDVGYGERNPSSQKPNSKNEGLSH